MYPLLQSTNKRRKQSFASTMAQKGVNQKVDSIFMDSKFAISIKNYLPIAEGRLERRKGLEAIYSYVGNAPSMVAPMTTDYLLFAYDQTLAAYQISTDTVTVIKNDFSSSTRYTGAKYGNYFFISNGVDKVWRTDTPGTWNIAEVANSPTGAQNVTAINSRLFCSVGSDLYYSAIDDGSDPPFTDWTVDANADSASIVSNRNGGDINSIVPFGEYVVVFQDFGKYAFYINTIDSAGTLSKVDVFQMSRIDQGGATGAINTPFGLFYLNEGGLYQLLNIGSADLPITDQEIEASQLLDDSFFRGEVFSNASLVYDIRRKIVIASYAGSTINNKALVFRPETQALSFITGWNLNSLCQINGDIYAASSKEGKLFKVFSGETDDGQPISTEFYQELSTGNLDARQVLSYFAIQGFLHEDSLIKIRFDIYNKKGQFKKDKWTGEWTAQHNNNSSDQYGTAKYGESAYGGDFDLANTVESFANIQPWIRNAQRIRLRLTSSDSVPHAVTFFKADIEAIAPIRFRRITQT